MKSNVFSTRSFGVIPRWFPFKFCTVKPQILGFTIFVSGSDHVKCVLTVISSSLFMFDCVVGVVDINY